MTSSRISMVLAVATAVAGSVGCGTKEPAGPTPGQLAVTYSGPGVSDGAMLLLVTGPVDAVTAKSGYQLASASAGLNATRVVVTGPLVPGELFKISVKDIGGNFGALIEAVADRNTFALGDPGQYQTTILK